MKTMKRNSKIEAYRNLQEIYLNLKDEFIQIKNIIDYSPSIIIHCINSNELRIDFVSKAISNYGFDEVELLKNNYTLLDLIHDNDIVSIREEIEQFKLLSAQEYVLNHRLNTPDDTEIWFETEIVVLNPSDSNSPLLCYMKDITDKKVTENNLYQDITSKNTLLSYYPDVILKFSTEGYLMEQHIPKNNNIMDNPEAALGKHIFDLFHPKVAKEIISEAMLAFKNKFINSFKFSFNRFGEHFEKEVRIIPSEEEFFIVIIRDMI